MVANTGSAGFNWPIRVYYEDADTAGVVYYANYLKFMERARTEWLRQHGVEQDLLRQDQGLVFAVRSVQVDYLKPARFNQLLSVSVDITERGKASATLAQEIRELDTTKLNSSETNQFVSELQLNSMQKGSMARLAQASGDVLCRGQIKIVCLDAQSLKPRAFPDLLQEEIIGDN